MSGLLVVLTVLSAIGQLVVVWLLTGRMWQKSLHPIAAGALQFFGVCAVVLLMSFAVGIILGMVALFGWAILSEPGLGAARGMDDLIGSRSSVWAITVLSLAPYPFALLRVIGLIRRGFAERKWWQGQT